jgi:hypothetical protein
MLKTFEESGETVKKLTGKRSIYRGKGAVSRNTSI